MTLPRQWQKHLLALLERGRPLEGDYYRSVELSYAHPDDVISGEGTRVYGGRFVRPGVRAVYGSADERTATGEAARRADRLAGRAGIRLADHTRITYVIAVKLSLHIDLTVSDPSVDAILPACLAQDMVASQRVGEFYREHGVQGLVYPSAVPSLDGMNLAVFRDVTPRPEINLVNRDEIIQALRRLSERFRS